MYQPMIFTGTRGISRMSLNAGANRWASRAVVVLQLAAWSAVGVVLLQKGVSSLRKVQEPRNSTLESNMTGLESLKMVKLQGEDDQLAVMPIAEGDSAQSADNDNEVRKFDKNTNGWGQSFDSMEFENFERSLRTSDSSRERMVAGKSNVGDFEEELRKSLQVKVMRSSTRENSKILSNFNDHSNRNLIISEQSVQSSENKAKQNTNSEDNTDKKNSDILENSNSSNENQRVGVDDEIVKNFHHELTRKMEENRLNLPIIPQEAENLQNSEIADIQESHENRNQDSSNAESNSNESQPVTSHPKKQNSSRESRRKFRVTPLSSSGAAAAVAMVAVGAIMLVLGPAVIILRALDERRQERRFLKLSGQDDLPPSYEQATLMDEAPRYSTLSLNTMFGPPPPPSPVTAASARSHPV